jgi:hypothetical protein
MVRALLNLLKTSPGSTELKNYLVVLDGFLNALHPKDKRLLMQYVYLRRVRIRATSQLRAERTSAEVTLPCFPPKCPMT